MSQDEKPQKVVRITPADYFGQSTALAINRMGGPKPQYRDLYDTRKVSTPPMKKGGGS